MSTQALYLKYRPQTFEEVVGQEPITRTLRNALRAQKIRHAYLFTGPRGTGKTTVARLLAKAVNCVGPEDSRPCNQCPLCIAVNEGRLLDLIEIDAASNRGIDEIRDIREKVGFRPNQGEYKVYVLDEAHMLTEPAFNALLKTLEEPPPHVIFALVTTDPHKIPATISSRCQRFDFRRISIEAVVGRLATIAEKEGIVVKPDALEFIAQQGTGALRDSISLLDQLTTYGTEITLDQVQMVLGMVKSEAAGDLVTYLAQNNVADGLDLINQVVRDGADPRQFGREVVEFLRGLLLIKQGAGTRLLNVTAEQAARMEDLAGRLSMPRLMEAIRLFNEAATDLKSGLQAIPQLPLEMALVECSLDRAAPQAAPVAEPAPKRVVAAEARPAPTEAPRAPQPTAASAPAETAQETTRETAPAAALATGSMAAAEASGGSAGSLTIEAIKQSWAQVVQSVRQRNPATQAVLNSGCEPVDVEGNEVVLALSFPFLREKLGDPQRKTEIQDALSEVMGVACRVKWVLASEFRPRQPVAARPAAPVSPQEDKPEAGEPSAADPPLGGDALKEINRWAQERGGETQIIP